MTKNQDVREMAAKCHVRFWEIAKEMGISEFTLSRKLRSEFSEEQKSKVFAIIEKVRQEHESN